MSRQGTKKVMWLSHWRNNKRIETIFVLKWTDFYAIAHLMAENAIFGSLRSLPRLKIVPSFYWFLGTDLGII